MFRWLVLVLLFALPAQFALAAVAGYCEHEEASASPHIGHHSHQHQHRSAGEQADATEGQSAHLPGQLHQDCSSCHVHVAQIAVTACEVFGAAESTPMVSAPIKLLASWVHQTIDRPNWAHAG